MQKGPGVSRGLLGFLRKSGASRHINVERLRLIHLHLR